MGRDLEPRIGGNRFRSLREVSEVFDVTSQTVTNWIRRGVLEAYKVGGVYRVSDAQLDRFLATSSLPISDNATAKARAV